MPADFRSWGDSGDEEATGPPSPKGKAVSDDTGGDVPTDHRLSYGSTSNDDNAGRSPIGDPEDSPVDLDNDRDNASKPDKGGGDRCQS